ncbi:MAG: hypothetical protein ACLUMK_03175 [Christensenellales bacterium]
MSKREKTKQEKRQWVLTVVILSFALSVVMSVLTSLFVDSAGLLVALLALIVLISIGVITDVIGTAVTSADEQPFIAMASKRIRGAKQALQLIRQNAFRLSTTWWATLSALSAVRRVQSLRCIWRQWGCRRR